MKKNRSKTIQSRFNVTSPPSHVPKLHQGMPRVIDVDVEREVGVVDVRGREDKSSSTILSNWLATAQSRITARSNTDAVRRCNEDIGQTRAMISKIIAKPKCSDKLLSKLPFRFIHDLVMNIGKAAEFDLGKIFR